MTRFRLRSTAVAGAFTVLASASMLSAQTTVTIPPLDFSGVIYSNYQYRVDQVAPNTNKFDVERVYLTFRMPAGDRASIRVTTDVYQQQSTANNADAYYRGWAIRLKYAYLQYNYVTGKPTDFTAVARMGSLHTVQIDHEEQFWPRWISQVDIERAGLMSSADIGVSTLMTLPNKLGEIYVPVTNGPGYTSRELDRFKDPQARLTLTPLANSTAGIFKTWAISPWIYRGLVASPFVNAAPPGPTSNGPIGIGLERNRWGVFSGLRDPRVQAGAQYTSFTGQSQTGANTPASPAVTVDSTGHILSGFIVVKPLSLLDTGFTRLNLVARYDKVTTNTNYNPSAQYHVFIGGLFFDLNRRCALSVDYQEQLSDNYPVVNGATITPTQPLRQWFVHMVANF
ncbi:MAG TPA: hypothetical protein VFD67_06105 [Gemmatimonadaceae bacterium]|nr:hypothetical protein [Gemmatimonadaceae bacterium]